VEALGDGIATGLLGAVSIGDDIGARQRAAEARGAFEDVVTALNARYGGRSLFAGAATEGPALADAETMLTAIAATTASAPDAATAATAIDDWFQAAGGGFETMGYLGATTDAPPAQIAPGQSLTYATRADSGAVRDLLAGLAKIVIGLEAPPAGDPDAASALFEEGARGLTGAIPGIVGERAALGEAEARIAETAAAQAAERTLLETARARLVAADPYDTATEFQAVEQQLQTVYTITARLAGLSLLNALR
ncbi:MAG: flagellin, partial [Pseudomonadota bacterium]